MLMLKALNQRMLFIIQNDTFVALLVFLIFYLIEFCNLSSLRTFVKYWEQDIKGVFKANRGLQVHYSIQINYNIYFLYFSKSFRRGYFSK